MSDLAVSASLAPASPAMRETLAAVRSVSLSAEQTAIRTEHLLHGGMYARTVRLNPESMHPLHQIVFSGVVIKVPTVLIISGPGALLTEQGWKRVDGYTVLHGSAGRESLFVTRGMPVSATMMFPTQAKTVEEAEREFTDEADMLFSRRSTNDIVTVTGE
jgi:hypothetical protein